MKGLQKQQQQEEHQQQKQNEENHQNLSSVTRLAAAAATTTTTAVPTTPLLLSSSSLLSSSHYLKGITAATSTSIAPSSAVTFLSSTGILAKDINCKDMPSSLLSSNIENLNDNGGNPVLMMTTGGDYHHHHNNNHYSYRRKTSAEIIKEAKTVLAATEGNSMSSMGNGNVSSGNGEKVAEELLEISGNGNIRNVGGSVIATVAGGSYFGLGNDNIGGARLVSTRRPITPREPRRQLYGKLAPPGRPPSAFSLRYLQYENRGLPLLDSVQQQSSTNNDISIISKTSSPPSIGFLEYPSSPDVDLKYKYENNNENNTISSENINKNITNTTNNNNHPSKVNNYYVRPQGKLPAILSPPQITSTTKIDILNEAMPVLSESDSQHNHKINEINMPIMKCSINSSNNKLALKEIQAVKKFGDEKEITNNEIHLQSLLTKIKSKSFDKTSSTSLLHQYNPCQGTSIELSQLNDGKNYYKENNDVTSITTTTNTTSINPTPLISADIDNDGKDKISANNAHQIKIDHNVNIIHHNEPFSSPFLSSGNNSLTSYYNKKRLTRSNDLLAQSNTETLLDLLKAHSGIKECNEETVQHINAILIELYNRIKGATGNWKGALLGGLYGLVECSSPKILLAVARVILALRVTGSNLTGACKLVFKIARSELNDHLFIETDVPELLIDGLGRASPLDEPEACIYGYGAVRFLANAAVQNSLTVKNSQSNDGLFSIGSEERILSLDSRNVNSLSSNSNSITTTTNTSNSGFINRQKILAQRLARHGAIQLMVLHLQILNEYGAIQKLSGPPLHVLYQLSATLRALAGIPQIISNIKCTTTTKTPDENFVDADGCYSMIKETTEIQEIQLELACPHLIKAAEISIDEPEIQANIVRTLSILSEHELCCECLSQFAARIGILLGPSDEVIKSTLEKKLVLHSRLGYILGNIMAKFDNSRIQLYENDVAMQYLSECLENYSKQNLTVSNQMGDTVVDVLIKLVRVIANMSVNPDVGFGLASKPPFGKILLHLLNTVNYIKVLRITSEFEELRLATLGALHNLCFYQENEDIDNISHNFDYNTSQESMPYLLPEICLALCSTLEIESEISKAEAARVLGNMTRNSNARQAFCTNGGLKVIVHSLNSNNYELIAASCGVLVNLLSDWERRAPFRELRGPLVLRAVLKNTTAQEDWILSALICQALWNFLIDSDNVIGSLGEDEADCIASILAENLDEDRLFNGQEPDDLWEQFASVATDLLEKIQASLSVGDTYCYSSDSEQDEIRMSHIPDGNGEFVNIK